MVKEYNEITVRVTESYESLACKLLEAGYKQVRRQRLLDRYYLPMGYDASFPTLEILNQAILIREIHGLDPETASRIKLSRKFKEFAPNGDIIRQSNIDVEVGGTAEGKNGQDAAFEERVRSTAAFLEAIGYRWAFDVADELVVFEKEGLGMAVQQVSGDRYLFIEIEENDRYQGIPNLIARLDETGISYDHSDYFCKKAQIIYDERYR